MSKKYDILCSAVDYYAISLMQKFLHFPPALPKAYCCDFFERASFVPL